MNDKIKTGLWQKTAKSGLKYYSGSVEINGQKYWCSLFKNDKRNDKDPELSLSMELAQQQERAPVVADELDDEIPF